MRLAGFPRGYKLICMRHYVSRRVVLYLVMLRLALGTGANAGLVLDREGHAKAITGLVVDSLVYDVTFAVGSFNNVFGAGNPPEITPTFLGREYITTQPILALIAAELNSGRVALVTDGNATAESVIVPYRMSQFRFEGVWTGGFITPPPWADYWDLGSGRSTGSAFEQTFSFARFTQTVAEPATIALFGLGVAALGWLRATNFRVSRHDPPI